jgi:cyclophilin family peptidyl-prolyl cis-trans isomerase
MCNKTRKFGKNNRMMIKNRLFLTAATFIALIFLASCGNDTKWYGKATSFADEIRDVYPELSVLITSRDVNGLLGYTNHESEIVRRQAWMALAHADVQDMNRFISSVLNDGSEAAWMSLSFHDLSNTQLQRITNQWVEGNINCQYACQVLGRRGNDDTMNHLLNHPDLLKEKGHCAMAAGRLASRFELDNSAVLTLTNLAFESSDSDVIQQLLYGFYRTGLNQFKPQTELFENTISLWRDYGIGQDADTDRYMVKILGEAGLLLALDNRDDRSLHAENQLGVEMARGLRFISFRDRHREPVKRLLSHPNPLVIVQTLENLTNLNAVPAEILEFAESRIVQRTRNGEIYTAALALLHKHNIDIRPYMQRLEFMVSQNPFLTEKSLPLYRAVESLPQYVIRLGNHVDQGGVEGLHAIRATTQFWFSTTSDFENRNQIRSIAWSALESGNRSMALSTEPLLMDESLFFERDYDRLKQALNQFTLPEDIGVYQAFTRVFNSRFESQSQGYIDSLAALGYNPLNRHLQSLGYDAEFSEEPAMFRIPDWELLHAMGTKPHWTLETTKGRIVIQLDLVSAPFTVSSIDSLTRAGAYNDIPFHRIVPNFVMQGGDVGRRDGFGGPGYRIPTEPSMNSYERGMAGVASSGIDTEGSQYFFMHQWSPHLDGGYTLFGRVVRGMDVVDRIQIGDKVERAYISLR